MKVIVPIAMTDAQLVSSNVTEDDHAEWAAGTTYASGARVIVIAAVHRIYESVQGANTGNDPVTDDGTWWVEISATNRWKVFDAKIADQTHRSGGVEYVIEPATLARAVALFSVEGSEIRVQVRDLSAALIYDETRPMVDDSDIIDWLTFFTTEPAFQTEAVFDDVPAYAGHEVTITGPVKVGEIVLGDAVRLGSTLVGSSVGLQDFSLKERDEFGNAIITERAFADEVDFVFSLPVRDVRRIKRVLTALRARPAVYFAGADLIDFGATTYGFYRDFEIPLESAGVARARLEIEGLT